jgi:hypothetical protein
VGWAIRRVLRQQHQPLAAQLDLQVSVSAHVPLVSHPQKKGTPRQRVPRCPIPCHRKKIHRRFRCTPRIGEAVAGFTMRDTVSCASVGAGRTGLPWGPRERQTDGSSAGGHPRFFWNTFPAAAPRSPPFRLHPMRDPANHPLARTPAGTPPAFSPAQASRDRASGIRGGRLRCACGRTSAPGWGRGWRDRCLPENADGPLPRFHPSAVPDASTQAWSNPRPPPCPDTISLHRGSSPPWSVTRSLQSDPRRTRKKIRLTWSQRR